MRPEAIRFWWRGLDRWVKLAVSVWAVMLGVLCARVFISPQIHSVYPCFETAGENWLVADELYQPYRPQIELDFRYSPLVAALFSPFSMLPERLGNVAWRLVNAAVFLGGLGWWSKTVLPRPLTPTQRGILFLAAMPLAVSNFNNGQCNALVIGLLLIAVAAVQTERWNLAGFCLALACLFKIYPLAVGLLLVVVYPRKLGGRLAAALFIGLALPFVLQHPEYVARQYRHWAEHLHADDRKDGSLAIAYKDLWLLLRLIQVPISHGLYLAVQLVLAACLAGLCLAGKLVELPRRRHLTSLLSLGCCWMILCGPATESCTYILLAPALAWAGMEAWMERPPWRNRLLLSACVALFSAGIVACWFPDGSRLLDFGLQPLAALLLCASLLDGYIRDLIRAGRLRDRAGDPQVATAA